MEYSAFILPPQAVGSVESLSVVLDDKDKYLEVWQARTSESNVTGIGVQIAF